MFKSATTCCRFGKLLGGRKFIRILIILGGWIIIHWKQPLFLGIGIGV